MRKVFLILCLLTVRASEVFGQTGSLTLTISNGFSLISNPYNSGGNTVAELFVSVPEGTLLYMLDASTQHWSVNQFQFGSWTHPTQPLPPGMGALIRNPTNAFSVTFTGTVPASVTATIYDGFNLLSWLPDSCPPAMDGDWIRFWPGNNTLDQRSAEHVCGFGWWPETVFQPGAAFFYVRGTPPPLRPSVYFNNYVPAEGINTHYTSTFGCIGTGMVAQIFYGTNTSNLLPLGEPLPIRELLPGKGYVDTSNGAIRELPAPGGYFFEIRVLDSSTMCPAALGWGPTSQQFISGGLYPPENLNNYKHSDPELRTGPITPFPVWHYPSNAVVVEGQAAQFVTTMFVDCGYRFQWQREPSSNQWINLLGETNLSLLLPSAQAADAGTYRLVITPTANDCTNRILPSVSLSVLTRRPVFKVTRFSSTEIELNITAEAGFDYAIEFSGNLFQWTNLTLISNAPAVSSVLDSIVPGAGYRLYRARLLP